MGPSLLQHRGRGAGTAEQRLAADIGDEAALRIYMRLLAHTRDVAMHVDCSTHVFLTEPPADLFWQEFRLHLQAEGDLGKKMQAAFAELFDAGYRKAIIIGSDCPGLQASHVQQAFDALAKHDVVIGPAADGGYYLLGMNRLHDQLFQAKSWSTETVYRETLADAEAMGLSHYVLPMLHDVDTVEDLQTAGWL